MDTAPSGLKGSNMNKTWILRLVCLLGLGIAGCGASFGRTGSERAHMYSTITRSELRMAIDDFDNIMLMDRRSRLSRYH